MNKLPHGCPAMLRNQEPSVLRHALARMTPADLQSLYRSAARFNPTGMAPRSLTDMIHFLERTLPTHRDQVLFLPPGSKVARSVRGVHQSRGSGGGGNSGSGAAKKAAGSDADQAADAKEKELKPSLFGSCFVLIDNDKQPGSPEHPTTEGAIGEVVHLKVDSEHLLPGDNVQFSLYRKGRKGRDGRESQADEKIEALTGQVGRGRNDNAAVARWFIPERSHAGAFKVGEDSFYFVAKQSQHKLELKSGELQLAEAFDGFIFYSPTQDEYLMVDSQEEFQAFSAHVEKAHALRGKTSEAWAKPVSQARLQELEKLRKEWEELFEGKVVAKADKALEEILLVRGNQKWGSATAFTHVPTAWRKDNKKIPGRWVKHSEKALQKQLDKVLKRESADKEEEKKGALEGKLKLKLFKSEPKAGSVWPWAHLTVKDHDKPGEKRSEHFDFSAEAAMGRY